MNEKNEQDIFKDLIDSIHVEDDVDSAKRESAQRSDLPQKEGQAQAGITPSASSPNVSDPHVVPVRRTDGVDEELPHWLTEKKRPVSESGSLRTAAPGGETRAANGNPPEPSNGSGRPSAAKRSAASAPRGQASAGGSGVSHREKESRPEEGFQVNISQQDYDRPSVLPAENPAQKQAAPPASASGKKRAKKKIKKQYRVGRALVLTVLFLALSVYLAFFAIRAFEDLTAVTLFGGDGTAEQQMTVEIPEGASTGEIAQILKKSGVITEPFAFRLYVMLKQEDGFQSGEYIMTDKMDYDSIIYALQAGTERTDVVEIMFPEGSTSVDIAQKLEEQGVCSASEFLAALNSDGYNYTFVDNIPQNELRFYKLEGYLFPNTHQFFVGESVNSVINRFLRDFNSQITDELRTRMNELNLTLDQTLVLASIIQKEASDPDEMKNVSEVFHNRLRNSDTYPNLQSDPTVYYVEQVIKKNIGMTNQEMYDAYNTYVCEGLPVGPICNPGLDAIEAALYPAQHEQTYYYFVTDNAGTYYYAETLDQHNANIAQADQVNAELAASSSSAAS